MGAYEAFYRRSIDAPDDFWGEQARLVDWHKLHPLIFTFPDAGYWRLGEYLAKAWSVGKQHTN